MKSAIIAAIVAAIISATAATAASTGLITGAQIKNGSVGLVDLSGKAKQSLRGQRGPAGPAGPAGAAGVQGIQGVAGGFDPAKVTYVTGPTHTFASGDIDFVRATCPANTKVLGGGYFSNIMHVAGSQTFDGQNWSVLIDNDYAFSIDANAFAICGAR
jgi:hypothetical protein